MTIKTILATACLLVSSMMMVAQTSSFIEYHVTIDGQKYVANDITIGENTVKLKGADDTYTSLDVTHGTEVELPMEKVLYCVAGTLTADLVNDAKDAVWRGSINDADVIAMSANLVDYESFSFAELDVSSLTSISGMFWNSKAADGIISSLKTIDFAGKTLDNVTDASYLFIDCALIESIDLSNVFTKVTDIRALFRGCTSLKTIDFSGCDLSNVTNCMNIFIDCPSVTTIKAIGCNDATITKLNSILKNHWVGDPDQVSIVTE